MTLKSWELGSSCTQDLLLHEEVPGRRVFAFPPPLIEQEMEQESPSHRVGSMFEGRIHLGILQGAVWRGLMRFNFRITA